MTLVQSASQKRRVVQEDVTGSHFHGLPMGHGTIWNTLEPSRLAQFLVQTA